MSITCSVCDSSCFFFQAEDGIRDLVRSRGLGDVYKRQASRWTVAVVSMRSGTKPSLLSSADKNIEKQPAWALSLIHI